MTARLAAVREPQQERSRVTRQRLLDAAVELLAEQGWAGTTVVVVAARAGVSRGAAQHHYPTREDLVAAAVAHLADARMAEFPRPAELPVGEERTAQVVRTAAGLYLGPLFRAALQLWAAAATDPALRAQVQPLEAALGTGAHRLVVDLLGVDERRPGVREAVQATLDLARGLGLADVISDDAARRERVVVGHAAMLHTRLVALDAFAAPGGPTGSERDDG